MLAWCNELYLYRAWESYNRSLKEEMYNIKDTIQRSDKYLGLGHDIFDRAI